MMRYPQTGNEVFVSFSLSNTMFSGIGKGTITREEVSADYLKALFSKYGVIVSAKPEQRRLLERVNALYDLELEIPDALKIIQLSEKNRRLVVISVQGLRRVNGSLLPEYTPEEFQEATFSFVKYYVQGRHYDELVAENEKLKRDLNSEIAWRNRVSDIWARPFPPPPPLPSPPHGATLSIFLGSIYAELPICGPPLGPYGQPLHNAPQPFPRRAPPGP